MIWCCGYLIDLDEKVNLMLVQILGSIFWLLIGGFFRR